MTYLLTFVASILIGLVVIAIVVANLLLGMFLADAVTEYKYTEKSNRAERRQALRDAVKVAAQKTRIGFS